MTTHHRSHNGHRWNKLKHEFKTQCQLINAPCWICREAIDYTLHWQNPAAFEPDHYHPVATNKHLQYDIMNLRPAHRRCNNTRGNTPPQQNARWVKAEW